MSVMLYGRKVAFRLLFVQFMTLVLLSLIFLGVKNSVWGLSAFAGGLAAWVPNVVFMLFVGRHPLTAPASGRVAWPFFIGEALKVIATIALLIVALGVFNAVFWPVVLTYLSVLVTQILAPAVINNKG